MIKSGDKRSLLVMWKPGPFLNISTGIPAEKIKACGGWNPAMRALCHNWGYRYKGIIMWISRNCLYVIGILKFPADNTAINWKCFPNMWSSEMEGRKRKSAWGEVSYEEKGKNYSYNVENSGKLDGAEQLEIIMKLKIRKKIRISPRTDEY